MSCYSNDNNGKCSLGEASTGWYLFILGIRGAWIYLKTPIYCTMVTGRQILKFFTEIRFFLEKVGIHFSDYVSITGDTGKGFLNPILYR